MIEPFFQPGRNGLSPEVAQDRAGLVLRAYRADDEALLEAWYKQAGQTRMAELAMGGHSLQQALPDLLGGYPGLRILQTETGRAVGFLCGETRHTPSGTVLWIRLLFIGQADRRRGYGRIAMSRYLELGCRAGHICRILLAVSGDNPVALSFWQALGFRTRRLVQPASPPGSTAHILVRECSSQ